MTTKLRFDTHAKKALGKWPHSTSRLWPPSRTNGTWLKAQPIDGKATGPRLMSAGTDTFKTQPDGLWVFLATSDGFADCIVIEACSSMQNFSDKRFRYQPSTTATMLHCPNAWLCGDIPYKRGMQKRWRFADGLNAAPAENLMLPTRFVRVLFFLKDDLYKRWCKTGVPAAHEFLASYSSINSYNSQAMQEFLRQMSPEKHFYKKATRKR